jgi:hypothetical protein
MGEQDLDHEGDIGTDAGTRFAHEGLIRIGVDETRQGAQEMGMLLVLFKQ